MIDYAAEFANFSGAFPDIQAVNVSAPGAGDGTEFVAAMVNDIWGRAQAMMDYAGLTPDGVQEAPDTAQILEAIGKGFGVGPGVGVTYWKNDTPAVFGDRVLLLTGQVIDITGVYSLLMDAVWVGAGDNATAPEFYRTSDAGGTTRNAGGDYLVLPDTRGLSLKNIGDAVISGRTKTGPVSLGSVQEDQGQGWQLAAESGGVSYYAHINNVNFQNQQQAGANYASIFTASTQQGSAVMYTAGNDGTNGDPRTGLATRDSTIGTRFGITY